MQSSTRTNTDPSFLHVRAMPWLLLAPLPAYVHRKADRHQPWKDRHVLYLGLLVLAVVVDLFVPEESLVTISPEEVLGPKILVRIFDTLF